MKMSRQIQILVILITSLFIVACQKSPAKIEVLKSFPINSTEGIITQLGVTLDTVISSDGKGSLKINVNQPIVIRLFEVKNVDVENARLVYKANIRAENVTGQAYLEMWCVFPGSGEFFSRSLQSPIKGTIDWSTVETPFFLQKGQKPEVIKLNIVINGKGTLWIDDITLAKSPLE
jgi:hypothetical protein